MNHRCPACGQRAEPDHVCNPPDFEQGDCSQCGDPEVLLQKSEDEQEPLHYVCKECFLRGL